MSLVSPAPELPGDIGHVGTENPAPAGRVDRITHGRAARPRRCVGGVGRSRGLIGLPAARVGGQADQVGDGAVERVGQVGQAAHGQAAAVLYRAEGLVGEPRAASRDALNDLGLGQPEFLAPLLDPDRAGQVPLRHRLIPRHGHLRPVNSARGRIPEYSLNPGFTQSVIP